MSSHIVIDISIDGSKELEIQILDPIGIHNITHLFNAKDAVGQFDKRAELWISAMVPAL